MTNPFDIDKNDCNNEELISLIGSVLGDSDVVNNVSEETIAQYASLELASFPTEITVSAGMTRQKAQYNPNTYHATITLDVGYAKDFIIQTVKSSASGSKVDTYVKLKQYLYKSLIRKIQNHETLLREALVNSAIADGVALREDRL